MKILLKKEIYFNAQFRLPSMQFEKHTCLENVTQENQFLHMCLFHKKKTKYSAQKLFFCGISQDFQFEECGTFDEHKTPVVLLKD